MHKRYTVLLIAVELIAVCAHCLNRTPRKKTIIKTPQEKPNVRYTSSCTVSFETGKEPPPNTVRLSDQTGLFELRNKWGSKEGVKVVEYRTVHCSVLYVSVKCIKTS